MPVLRLFAALLLLLPLPAAAHEFWIEPERYQVAPGEVITGYFKNGENFKGGNLAFFDRSSARYELVHRGKRRTLSPRSGDTPALNVAAPGAGLVIVAHETTASLITYREWPKFLKFARHKDFPQAAAQHEAQGWSKTSFRERYTRHVKALIAVSDGGGNDGIVGMETEFVALTNPYDPKFNNKMSVQVLLRNKPRPNAQVEIFEKAPSGRVKVSLTRTNGQGVASLSVKPGHAYLLDAVVLRPSQDRGEDDARPIVWETVWAALTFAVPK